MLPTFASPWLLWGLLSVGLLAAIYMLRMRSRRVVVSSLLLWIDQRSTDTGGRIWQKLRTPLTFFVELLVLFLLVMAAANPLWHRDGAVPIVVVLDNSYSMRASNAPVIPSETSEVQTAQSEARQKLAELLDKEPLNAQVVLAGRHPLLLKERFNSPESLDRLTPHWQCIEPTADLDSAITLARQVGGLGARVLVITDHLNTEKTKQKLLEEAAETETATETGTEKAAKPEETEKETEEETEPTLAEQVRWIAVGNPLPNLAIVSAVRRDAANNDEQGRAVVEVANLSTQPISSELSVRFGERHSSKPLDIKPGQIRRFTIPMTDNQSELELTLPPDALELDNQATLLPESAAKLRVSMAIKDKELQSAIRRALQASGRVELTDVSPQLRFSDQQTASRDGCWDVLFLGDKESQSILGPFVLEKTSDLIEGISLEGIVMSQSKSLPMPGKPLVTSDDATLLSLDVLPDERERIFIQYTPKKTTLLESPDFPALVWNLLRWRESGLPERCRPNVRLGEPIRLRLLKNRKSVELISPTDKSKPLEIFDDATILSCDTPGRHAVVIDQKLSKEQRLPVSANVLFRDESDLRNHRSGQWGTWKITNETRRDYRSILIPLLLSALVAWVIHGRMIRKESNQPRPVSSLTFKAFHKHNN